MAWRGGVLIARIAGDGSDGSGEAAARNGNTPIAHHPGQRKVKHIAHILLGYIALRHTRMLLEYIALVERKFWRTTGMKKNDSVCDSLTPSIVGHIFTTCFGWN